MDIHLNTIREGPEAWNRLMEGLTRNSGRYDEETPFWYARLDGADLQDLNLRGVNLKYVNLSHANLRGSSLENSNLSYANLNSANLENTFLGNAILDFTELDHSNFHQSRMNGTILSNVNLNGALGLDSVLHIGPSTIGVNTLMLTSSGLQTNSNRQKEIERFYRNAGIPEDIIEFYRTRIGTFRKYSSCFISYSSEDNAFVTKLHDDLLEAGVQCWYAPEELKGGAKLIDQIDTAIKGHDKLLLVLSIQSMNNQWVRTEIRRCLEAEKKEGKRKLFPLRVVDMPTLKAWECFDAGHGKDLAVEVREYFIPDFSNWSDHDAYKKAFDRLLKDLRGSEEESSKI